MYRIMGMGSWLVAAIIALAFASSASAASFEARGSTEQVDVTGLTPNVPVSLLDSSDSVVQTRNANSRGGALFRDVSPGTGYTVQSDVETSDPLTVTQDPIKAGTSAAPPDPSIYNQTLLTHGYGYMTMRDGTKLAYDVHPPTDVASSLPLPCRPQQRDNRRRAAAQLTQPVARPWSSTPATATRILRARSAASRLSPT